MLISRPPIFGTCKWNKIYSRKVRNTHGCSQNETTRAKCQLDILIEPYDVRVIVHFRTSRAFLVYLTLLHISAGLFYDLHCLLNPTVTEKLDLLQLVDKAASVSHNAPPPCCGVVGLLL